MSSQPHFPEDDNEPAGERARRPRAGRTVPQGQDDLRPTPRGGRDKSVRIGRTRVGKGVFARKRYAAASVIGEIYGDVIEDPHYGSSYCMDIGGGCMLEPAAPFRFVNHSCDPNCEFDVFELSEEGGEFPTLRHVFLLALREIKPGEELTIAYNWSAETAIPCRCESPNCCGWIVDPDQLDEVRARLAAE